MLILIATVSNVSAQIDILCEESIYVGEELSVMIVEDDIPVVGVTVSFTQQDCDMMYRTDNDGIVLHTPYATGYMDIEVMYGRGNTEKTVMVVDEPWVPGSDVYQPPIEINTPVPTPTPTPTPEPTPSSTEKVNIPVTPGTIATIPPITLEGDPDDTINKTQEVLPEKIVPFTTPEPEPTITETVEIIETPQPVPKKLPREPESPGFGGIVAIGILSIVYFLRR